MPGEPWTFYLLPYPMYSSVEGFSLSLAGGWYKSAPAGPIPTGISIYIESVYFLPGLGRETLTALNGFNGYDLPLILGVILLSATAIIVLNGLADITARLIDPRITLSARSGAGGLRSGLA